jgi:hypothetical protein
MYGGRQRPTFVTFAKYGVGDNLTGFVIFASLKQFSSRRFWQDNPRIKAIIKAVPEDERFSYPSEAGAALSQQYYVNPRNKKARQEQLEQCEGVVEKILREGDDVLVHCHSSVHRAPTVGTALYCRITGGDGEASCSLLH